MRSKEILLDALSRSLKTSHFHRSGGAEKQGDRELIDYVPKTKEEQDYWDEVIDLLLGFKGEYKSKAESIIIENFPQQYVAGNSKAILEAVKEVIKRNDELPESINQTLVNLINRKDLNDELKAEIISLKERLAPTDLKLKIFQFVIKAPYDHVNIDGEYVDKSELRARKFAKELLKESAKEWQDYLVDLQKGEQRQTFAFANEIGSSIENKVELFDLALDTLSKIDFSEQNESFIKGLVSGVDDSDFTRNSIDKLITTPCSYHAFQLSRFLKLNLDDFNKLIQLASNDINLSIGFQYLKTDSLSDDEFDNFIKSLIKLGGIANAVAVDLFDERIGNDPIPETLIDLGKSLVGIDGLILSMPEVVTSQLYLFKFERSLKKLLDQGLEKEIAISIMQDIIEACSKMSFYHDTSVQRIFNLLLDFHWESTWEIVGSAFLDIGNESWYGIKTLLGLYRNFKVDQLSDWLDNQGKIAPRLLTMVIQYEVSDDNESRWNPIVLYLLDKYGSDEKLLDELSARLHSFSVTGSAISLFETRIELLKKLQDHKQKEVRDFVENEIKRFKSDIEREKRFHQNFELGEL